MTESDIQREIILEATRLGHRLFVNRQGRAKYKARSGEVYTVPYGVGGVGGSDLVGWTYVEFATEPSVRIAVFTAIEVKSKTGRVTDEQQKFIDAVNKARGLAAVCRSVDDYLKLIGAA